MSTSLGIVKEEKNTMTDKDSLHPTEKSTYIGNSSYRYRGDYQNDE